jgi:hypothetical protein
MDLFAAFLAIAVLRPVLKKHVEDSAAWAAREAKEQKAAESIGGASPARA